MTLKPVQSLKGSSSLQAEARNGGIDYLRFFGACGIILFHMQLPGAWVGLAALPMFVILLVYYGLQRPVSHHIRRLLLPWVIWSAIYGMAKTAQSLVSGKPILSEFEPWMLLTGTSIHLWFLPFSVIFLTMFGPLPRAVPLKILLGGSIILSLGALCVVNVFTATLPIPLAQWFTVLPAACLGLVTAGKQQILRCYFLFVLTMAGLIYCGWSVATWQLMISAALIMIVLYVPIPSSGFSKSISGLSLGMYLIHPFIIALLQYALALDTFFSFVIVALSSLLGVLIVRRLMPWAV